MAGGLSLWKAWESTLPTLDERRLRQMAAFARVGLFGGAVIVVGGLLMVVGNVPSGSRVVSTGAGLIVVAWGCFEMRRINRRRSRLRREIEARQRQGA